MKRMGGLETDDGGAWAWAWDQGHALSWPVCVRDGLKLG